MFSYTVRCSFSDPAVIGTWLAWLKQEHIQDVVDAGANSAEIFQIDETGTYEIRYCFESKAEFEKYEANHAPRLRQEGREKFPLELGLQYSRTTGESVFRYKS